MKRIQYYNLSSNNSVIAAAANKTKLRKDVFDAYYWNLILTYFEKSQWINQQPLDGRNIIQANLKRSSEQNSVLCDTNTIPEVNTIPSTVKLIKQN